MKNREDMNQEEIEATFKPTDQTCPKCGEMLYQDTIKETLTCLECTYETAK